MWMESRLLQLKVQCHLRIFVFRIALCIACVAADDTELAKAVAAANDESWTLRTVLTHITLSRSRLVQNFS